MCYEVALVECYHIMPAGRLFQVGAYDLRHKKHFIVGSVFLIFSIFFPNYGIALCIFFT